MKLTLPKIVFGSSALGNLYEIIPEATKQAIVKEWILSQPRPVIDSAGKYGAGLALENIGRYLTKAEVKPEEVLISNKLG
jgi:D-threo-aldose 1-dehydrogenase